MTRHRLEGRPRWVTALAVAGLLLVLLVLVLHLTGAGPRHGVPQSAAVVVAS